MLGAANPEGAQHARKHGLTTENIKWQVVVVVIAMKLLDQYAVQCLGILTADASFHAGKRGRAGQLLVGTDGCL